MESEPLSGRVGLGIRSFLALLLGVVGFFMVVLAALMPGTAAVLVVKLFAAYALLDGLLSIFIAAKGVRRAPPRFLMTLEGLVDVATSVTAFILVQVIARTGSWLSSPPGPSSRERSRWPGRSPSTSSAADRSWL